MMCSQALYAEGFLGEHYYCIVRQVASAFETAEAESNIIRSAANALWLK
jgi:hypothetical protein